MVLAGAVACFCLAGVLGALSLVMMVSGDDAGDRGSNAPPTVAAGQQDDDDRDEGVAAITKTPEASDDVEDLALSLWYPTAGSWVSGLEADDQYIEGQTVPFMVTFATSEGAFHHLSLTYDCESGDAQALDYLSGVSDWVPEILEAKGGPGDAAVDETVQVPNTPGFTGDDAGTGTLRLYGATVSGMPEVGPGGTCSGERTLQLSMDASAEAVTIIGSVHLASEEVHGAGDGAASAGEAYGLTVEVADEGATALIEPEVVSIR
jgi:hypothetical protein